jgi:soluble lytic murein transglycosylase-like protein
MTRAIRSRGGFIAAMILTAILAFPLVQISTASASGERSNPTDHRPADRSAISLADADAGSLPSRAVRIGPEDATTPPMATTAVVRGREAGRHAKVCRIDWTEGRGAVERLVRCAARHFGVGVATALYVADRESKFQPRAYNRSSCAKGIFQHLCRYWPDRATDFGFRGWSAFNARANIMVTMKMVRKFGWEPWGA